MLPFRYVPSCLFYTSKMILYLLLELKLINFRIHRWYVELHENLHILTLENVTTHQANYNIILWLYKRAIFKGFSK